MMVTLVPPDSGPRMGLSDSTEGFFEKKRNIHSLGPRLDLTVRGIIIILRAKVLFLSFVVSNILPCLEGCSGKMKGCHTLGLINSLGSLVLLTLKGKLT